MMRRTPIGLAVAARLAPPLLAASLFAPTFFAPPLSAQPLPTAPPEEVGLSSERLARVGDVFQSYVDEGRIAGALGMVARRGRLVYVDQWGMRDVAARDPLEHDDIFRIFSMSKPITSVAVMMLFEEGRFMLTEPVGRYLPELAGAGVARLDAASGPDAFQTVRALRQMTIQDLLRHTSGLTYGAFSNSVVDQQYRRDGVLESATLAEMVTKLGRIPLAYQPGERFNYSVSTDVLARLVEVVSGRPFDAFLRERIFEPLGMVDTGFYVPRSEHDRFSRPYGHTGPEGALALGDTLGYTEAETFLSGGGGLVGTAADYMRFAQMLLNGGELEGVRLLSPKTIELMTVDHLQDRPTGFLAPGWGFGLGFAVRRDASVDATPGSLGEYYWFGVAGTSFWIDPVEELIGVFMVQIFPSRDIAFRQQFKNLVYQAVVR